MANSGNSGVGEASAGAIGTSAGIRPPKFTQFAAPAQINNKEERQHQDLLHYVYPRVTDACADRELRLRRFASIDRAVSTWQKLSQEDAERQMHEEHTGRMAGLPVNLPLLATSLDDTSAFFSEIFAPQSRDFFTVPDGTDKSSAIWKLAQDMNRDTRFTDYYAQVARAVRGLLKYNTSGFHVEWLNATEVAMAKNRFRAVDMYNTLWDSAVYNPADVSTQAEWAAEFKVMTRRSLVTGVLNRGFQQDRVERALAAAGSSYGGFTNNLTDASFRRLFVRPPNHVGISMDGQDSRSGASGNGNQVDWGSFGLGSASSGVSYGVPRHAFENHTVWIWLDPREFGLVKGDGDTSIARAYELWKLEIVEGIVIAATPAVPPGEQEEDDETIPLYLAPYTDDDMGEAQRSVMEYMRGFQRFSSFLMNIWVLASRKSVYGVTYYDKDILNPAKIKQGDVAGYVALEMSGRDIRTGLWKDTNSAAVNNVIEMLTNSLNMVQQFFPNQALPSQVAGIDRAVKDQVSAVLAGGQARLRMQTRVIDANLFLPVRKQAVRNRLRGEPEGFKGLQEEEISTLLGGGLKSLSAERAAASFRELLQLIGVSQEILQITDLPKLLNAFSETLNLDIRLGDFFQQPPPQQAQQPQEAQPEQPQVAV